MHEDRAVLVETTARDGLGRTAAARLAGRSLETPLVLQCVASDLPPVGDPSAVLLAQGENSGAADSFVFRWGPSPLFPGPQGGPRSGIELPRLIPRAYGVAKSYAPEELVIVKDGIAGALPSATGSSHLEPLAKSAEIVALQNLTELRGRPREFVRALAGARAASGPRPLLFAAAVADPANLALFAYLGADMLDDFEAVLAASAGIFLYTFGSVRLGLEGACHCPACLEFFARDEPAPPEVPEAEEPAAEGEVTAAEANFAGELGEGRGAGSRRDLPAAPPSSPLFAAALAHNRRAIDSESRICARAVRQGTLRELVETRVRAHPWLVAALRNFDREFYGPAEALTPIHKERLHALSQESLHRPEVRRWGERLRARYRPPPSARILLLVPCSARKPYSLSLTHQTIDRALRGVRPTFAVHRSVVTSPLGVVPEELERVFPAAHYDIPVTGDWVHEEQERVSEQVALLCSLHPYKAVVSLVGDDLPGLADSVSGLVECAKKERPFKEALAEAAQVLAAQLSGEPDVGPRQRIAQDVASLARFQFGPEAGAALMERAEVRGRYPWVRVLSDGKQLAMHVPDKGRLALTLDGAERVASAGAYRVFIEDFELRGDIFCVGVRFADPEIRAGDSIAVIQGGAVVAAGFARMAALEMTAMRRGTAVSVRHRKGKGGSP